MCGNGVVIGMEAIHPQHKLILPDLLQALVTCIVVAVGVAKRSTAECRIATAILRAIATAESVSV